LRVLNQLLLPAAFTIRTAFTILAACAFACAVAAETAPQTPTELLPPGFSSVDAKVKSGRLHYVRGGRGPAVILIHGFPQDWAEYRAIMPRLAQRFTVVAVDLPGIGGSAPPSGAYDTANLAAQIRILAEALNLDHPYVVGHDLGGPVAYAYVRQFPAILRGAMILDVPMAGLPGSDVSSLGFWHIGFILAPKEIAEKLVVGRQAAFLDWFYEFGKFTPAERTHFINAYGAPQLHAAFEIYRALPKDAEWNANQTTPNSVPLVVAVGEKSFFAPFLSKFVEGYRAMGMTHVESAQIPRAGHYLIADNPEAVADLIERHAGGDTRLNTAFSKE
jgi:pimeloyl-ACP methyl ester carboxylesterase